MSLSEDFRDAYRQVEELLQEERTCHDDCMCDLCIVKQQAWEMSAVFTKLQSQLAALQEECRWIPVGERLPGRAIMGGYRSNTVLVSDGAHKWIACWRFDHKNWMHEAYGGTTEPTHWRLITLPEGGK